MSDNSIESGCGLARSNSWPDLVLIVVELLMLLLSFFVIVGKEKKASQPVASCRHPYCPQAERPVLFVFCIEISLMALIASLSLIPIWHEDE